MIPVRFVVLESLPLTANGKVDHEALRAASDKASLHDRPPHIGARTPTEEVLAGIWADVLGCEEIGIDDNFFDLGGHSLLGIQMVWRASEAFGIDVSLHLLFESPTIAALADTIDREMRAGRQTMPLLRTVARTGDLSLSYAEQRLWFLNELESGSSAYNVPAAIRMRGPLDDTALLSCVDAIVGRHEVLRTSFAAVDGRPVRRIAEKIQVQIVRRELRHLEDRSAAVTAILADECSRAFDLGVAPLLRVTLVRVADDEHVLILVLHHIVCDGWSIGVLLRDFTALYRAALTREAAVLPELPIQYIDYAVWLRDWLEAGELDRQLEYWKKKLASPLPQMTLRLDRPLASPPIAAGASVSRMWSQELRGSLSSLSRRESATLYMILITGISVLLHFYSGEPDILLGTDIAARRRLETEPLVGFFVNQLVFRINVVSATTFRDLLQQVRKTAHEAYANQDVPFERLVAELGAQTRDGRQSLFNVKLALQPPRAAVERVGPIEMEFMATDDLAPKFDLLFNIVPRENTLSVSAQFDPARFVPFAVAMMIELFAECLSVAASAPDITIDELLAHLSEAEKKSIRVAAERVKNSMATERARRRPIALPAQQLQ
jgi:non-ribosomal peptide synthetase component F/acyl carrier protein